MSDGNGIIEGLGRILGGGVIVLGGNLLGAAASFLTRVVTARYLGPSDYGLLVLGITVLGLSSIVLTFGLSKGLAQRLPNSSDEGELFQSSLLISIPASVLFALPLVIFAQPVAEFLSSPAFAPVLVLFAVTLPFYLIVRLATACMQGFKSSKAPIIFRNLSFQTTIAILVVVGMVLGLTVVQVAAIWPIAGAFSTLVAIYYLRKRTNVLSPLKVPSAEITQGLLTFSVPLMIADLGWELMVQIDNVFLSYFHTSRSVGVYDAAFMLVHPFLLVMQSFGYMLLPIFSDIYQDNDFYQLARIYRLATKWMVLAVLPIYLVVVTFPDFVLQLIYGGNYTVASTALIIVFTGAFIPVLLGLNHQAHIAFGNTRTILIGNVAAAAINLVANLTLVPLFRIEGAALASALALGSLFTYWAYTLYIDTGIQPFYRGMLYPVAISSVVFVGILLVTSGLSENLRLGVTVFVYGFAHLLILLACALEDEDRELIRQHSEWLLTWLPL